MPVTVAYDTTHYDIARAPFLGQAVGQTFYAPETLLTKLTVWRPPGDLSAIGVMPYITAVDTIWSPPRPNTHMILYRGPKRVVYDSDPPGGFIPMPFVIDPPLVLPGAGFYAFFLQAEDCDPGVPGYFAADDRNGYPQGIYWITGRALSSCYLRGVAGGEDNTDLLFQIEFCRDTTTAVRPSSWGRLKTIYR